MAEGLLLGFDGVCDATFTGPVTPDKVRCTALLAEKYGFKLVDYKRECVLGSDQRGEEVHAIH